MTAAEQAAVNWRDSDRLYRDAAVLQSRAGEPKRATATRHRAMRMLAEVIMREVSQ